MKTIAGECATETKGNPGKTIFNKYNRQSKYTMVVSIVLLSTTSILWVYLPRRTYRHQSGLEDIWR
ncbi:unnamed protein product, partial [Nesidiocoris tenuis]